MSPELTLAKPDPENQPAGAAERYVETLRKMAADIPEVQERLTGLEAAGNSLIEEYDIDPKLFNDDGRAFVFTLIAARQERIASLDEKTQQAEAEFIERVLAMLAYEYSSRFEEFKAAADLEIGKKGHSPGVAILEKYTDRGLSSKVKEVLTNGGLKDVRQRLGLTAENQDEFGVVVLSVANDAQLYGLEAGQLDWDNLPENEIEKDRLVSEHLADARAIKAWKEGLLKRGKSFASEMRLKELPLA